MKPPKYQGSTGLLDTKMSFKKKSLQALVLIMRSALMQSLPQQKEMWCQTKQVMGQTRPNQAKMGQTSE